MNKNNLLLSLIIFQGLLIVIGIIVIIYVIFSKLQINKVDEINFKNPLSHSEFTLINDNQIQVKSKKNNKIYFEIYNLKNSKKLKTIIVNEN